MKSLLAKITPLLKRLGASIAAAVGWLVVHIRSTAVRIGRILYFWLRKGAFIIFERLKNDRRLLALSSVALLLIASGLLDRVVDRPVPRNQAVDNASAPLSATSTVWFCAMTPSSKATPDNGTVTIANVGGEAVTGTITVAPQGTDPSLAVKVPLGMAAGSRSVIKLAELVDAPFSGTTVQVDGGNVVVEHTYRDAASVSTAPCASSSSDNWYSADGSTADGSSMLLGLYNPFPERVTVDFSFVSSESRATPPDLAGLGLEPGTMTVVDVGQYQARREWIASRVTARSGRLIVDQLQTNRPGVQAGSSLTAMSPMVSEQWFIPNGFVTTGITDGLSFYNPGDREAAVEVRLLPETPEAPSFEVLVPAENRQLVRMNIEQVVPPGGHYAAALRVTNGVPIAVSRTSVSTADSPTQSVGLSMSSAAVAPSTMWAMAYGATADPGNQTLWLTNPGVRPATVFLQISGLGETQNAPPVGVPPGEQVEVAIDNPGVTTIADPAILARANAPILVGRDVTRGAGPGYGSTAAIAVR